MKDILIFPDLNNLKQYFDYSPEKIAQIKEFGIRIRKEYEDFDYLAFIIEEFRKLTKEYGIEEHFEDLIWLIIYFNEHMLNYTETLQQNYKDDVVSKEVANFLLAFKRNETDGKIEIAIKDNEGTHKITNNGISRWMANLIMEAVESKKVPLEIFGEKLFYNLYRSDSDFDKIEIENLQKTANMKLDKPSKFNKRIITKFYKYLKPYLEEHTKLATLPQYVLTNIQAEFYFDLFSILGLIDASDSKLTKAKYIRTIFDNSDALNATN